MYTYFPGSQVYIYPSVNADDGGDLSTEKNLSRISENFMLQNFVVNKELYETFPVTHNSFDVEYTQNGADFNLYSGICLIAGRTIKFTPSPNEYVTLYIDTMIAEQSYQPMMYNNLKYNDYINGIRTDAILEEMSSKSPHLLLALMF